MANLKEAFLGRLERLKTPPSNEQKVVVSLVNEYNSLLEEIEASLPCEVKSMRAAREDIQYPALLLSKIEAVIEALRCG